MVLPSGGSLRLIDQALPQRSTPVAQRLPNNFQGSRRISPPEKLYSAINDAIDRTYGAGYSFEPRAGVNVKGGAGTKSGRHVAGGPGAMDVRILDPQGNQLYGKQLEPLAKTWVSTYGSIGINATPGTQAGAQWTHLDLVKRPNPAQRVWAYDAYGENPDAFADMGISREELMALVDTGAMPTPPANVPNVLNASAVPVPRPNPNAQVAASAAPLPRPRPNAPAYPATPKEMYRQYRQSPPVQTQAPVESNPIPNVPGVATVRGTSVTPLGSPTSTLGGANAAAAAAATGSTMASAFQRENADEIGTTMDRQNRVTELVNAENAANGAQAKVDDMLHKTLPPQRTPPVSMSPAQDPQEIAKRKITAAMGVPKAQDQMAQYMTKPEGWQSQTRVAPNAPIPAKRVQTTSIPQNVPTVRLEPKPTEDPDMAAMRKSFDILSNPPATAATPAPTPRPNPTPPSAISAPNAPLAPTPRANPKPTAPGGVQPGFAPVPRPNELIGQALPQPKPAAPTPVVARPSAQRPGYDAGVASMQRDLKARGFDPGPIDGINGPRTQAAAERARQQSSGGATANRSSGGSGGVGSSSSSRGTTGSTSTRSSGGGGVQGTSGRKPGQAGSTP